MAVYKVVVCTTIGAQKPQETIIPRAWPASGEKEALKAARETARVEGFYTRVVEFPGGFVAERPGFASNGRLPAKREVRFKKVR